MAYSDYGGYAYRNGERVEERSDFTIMPDGKMFGTPGAYPGFAAIAAGADAQQVKAIASAPHYHAVLGDGPIFVGLYKQSSITVHRGIEEIETPMLEKDWEKNGDQDTECEIDGYRIEARWREEDNHYLYVRLTQPDGTVWGGFSGYGVGAGLEDCGYGFSTPEREDVLFSLFPRDSAQGIAAQRGETPLGGSTAKPQEPGPAKQDAP